MTFRILLSLLLLTVCAYGQGAGSVAVVPTVAELTNRPPSALNPVVSVSGYRTNGDWGPARTMRYVPTSTQAIDNGCVFPTVTGTGRWEAADCDGPSVSVAYYGTYADNESNDSDAFSAAFNRAVQWRGESGGGVVYVPAGDYRVNWNMATPLANEDSITITGDGPGATALRPWTNTAPVLKLLGRNITVEKLMLKGDILTPQGVGLQLGDTNLATGAVVAANFRDLYILDFTTGLYIEGIDQAHFDGMVIQRCTNGLLASPRWYATSGTNAVMSKVKLTRSVWLGNYGDAITLRGGYCEQIDFDTCVIEQNYGKAMVFQQYNPISGNPFRGIQIRNCFFEFNNNSAPAGDYYDIEFQPAVGTGANAIYSSMIEGCWFQTTRSSHTPIRILNGGDYRIQNNDFISNNSYFISVTNSPVIDLDVSFAKVLVEAGSSPQINWVNANRVELKGITNATPSLILTNTGRLLFSDGVNAPDLNVYRSAARVLAAEGTFRSIGTAASDQAFLASVSGDALGRFTALNSGRFEWGDGAGARNIFMERSGSGIMEMKGASWTFNRANSTDWALQLYATGDTQYRLSLRADGRMEWSDGANPAGISLAPVSGNILNLLATYRIQRTNATDSAMLTGVLGESASRFEVDSAGRMSWGDGTGPRLHGSLERTAAGELTLKTNLVIAVGGGLTINGERVTDWTGSGLSIVGGALTSAGAADGDKGDITVSGSGATWTIDADSVALWTDTTGDYVASVSGTANEVGASGSGEGAAVTVSLPATIDLGGKTSFELPNGASPTVDAFGEIAGDNDAWAAGRGAVVAYDGTAATRLVGVLASDTPTSGQVPKWQTGGTILWEDDQTGAGGLSDGDKGDITVSGSGATWTIDADSVGLGTDTTGNYVASVAGTANEVDASGSGEGAAVTVSLPATIDLGGKTSFELPNAAAPTVDAFGEIAGDNDAWAASRGAAVFYDGTAATRLVGVLSSDTPSNGQVPKWNTGGTITWEDDATGGGGISDGDKGDITVSGSGATWTIDADSVGLGTDTTGNYVASVAGTANEVSASGSGEGAAVTVSLPATIDLGGKTSFELPNGASPTVDAFGEIAGDDDAWAASRGAAVFYDGTAATRLVGVLSSDTPSAGQVPKWQTGGTITWEDDTSGSGGSSTNVLVNTNLVTQANFIDSPTAILRVDGSKIQAHLTNNLPAGGYGNGFLPLHAGVSNMLSGDLFRRQNSDIREPMWEDGTEWNAVGLRANGGKLSLAEYNTNDWTVLEEFIVVDPTDPTDDVVTFSNSGFNNKVVFEADVDFQGMVTGLPGGGDVVTTADNVLSGVNQFTNGLGQVFSVPPRVLGGRINGWTAPQMTPGTNATSQAQYKVLGDGIPTLEFDGTTSEEISMVGLLNQDPDRGSFVTITFASDDTANTVCWQAQWQLLTLRGIDTNLLSSAATWTSNIPGTARVPTNITFSLNAPSGLVGSTNDFSKPYMLRITRLPGSDSSLSNAYLIGVDHRYGR